MTRGPHTVTVPGQSLGPVAAIEPAKRLQTPLPLTPSSLTPLRTHIGRYELRARLGAGGMGEVFLARVSGAHGFEKEVVIKRVLPHLSQDLDFVVRFIEEGKLVVQLKHASIAQVLDMGEQDGVYFMAMEYIDGRDLGEIIRIATACQLTIPRPLVIHLLLALLDALDYAHHALDYQGKPLGIIHRDVSPSNVMVSRSGEVKLLDFGIARATERLQSSTIGAIRGKYSYMSPQQAAGGVLDARSDLFSVGVIAWELFAGSRPFDGASDLLTLDRVRFHEPGPLNHVAAEVTPELSEWVAKMLAKDPEHRFQSALEAADELRQIVLSSGELASSRGLANWLAYLEEQLPESLKQKQASSLSLDELLQLGLEKPARELSPARVLARETPLKSPVSLDSQDLQPVVKGRPKWWQRRSFVGLLVANIALLGVIAWLLWAPDAPVLNTREVLALRGAISAPPTPSFPSKPTELGTFEAGLKTGEALAQSLSLAESGWVTQTLRSQPPGALLQVQGYGQETAPWTLKVRRGEKLQVRGTLAGSQSRSAEVIGGVRGSYTLMLKTEAARGSVRFRFFPASGTVVSLNGKSLTTKTNVVNAELARGEHIVELVSANGRRLQRRFTVEPSKVTNLGTIDLSKL